MFDTCNLESISNSKTKVPQQQGASDNLFFICLAAGSVLMSPVDSFNYAAASFLYRWTCHGRELFSSFAHSFVSF